MNTRNPGSVRDRWIGRAAGTGLVFLAILATCARRPRLPAEYGLLPGDRLVYETDYGTISKADFRALFESADPAASGASSAQTAGAQSYRTRLRGDLVMTVLERGPERLLCAYRIDHPRIELDIGGEDAPAQAEATAALVGRETFAEMEPGGRLLRVLVAPQTDSVTRGYILALLSKTQFVLPADARLGALLWTAVEEDPNGRYLARYETGASFEGRSAKGLPRNLAPFRKTKDGYLPAGSAGKALLPRLPTVVEPSGATEMVFDLRNGFLEAAAGSENERVTVSGKEVARVESRLSLRRLRGEKALPSELVALLEAFRWRRTVGDFIPLTMALSEEESELAIQRAALGQATLGSLMAELAEAEAAGLKQNTGLYLKFKALVYLYPEASADLGKRLADASASSIARDIIGGALSTVGHPEAQAALTEVIRSHRAEPGFIMGLIQGLSQVRFPTESAEKTLGDIAAGPADESVYTAALYGLGSMSRNLKATDPGRAGRIVEELLALMRPSMTEKATDTVLKALGNSGSDKALPVLMDYTRHGSWPLRASAAAALRFVDSGQADTVLETVLGSDPDAVVRRSALLALGYRKPTAETVRAQIRALSQDESEAVRLAALNNMANMAGGFPEILDVIRRAAKEDVSESVRQTAGNILSAHGSRVSR